jgi:hypothetical protein
MLSPPVAPSIPDFLAVVGTRDGTSAHLTAPLALKISFPTLWLELALPPDYKEDKKTKIYKINKFMITKTISGDDQGEDQECSPPCLALQEMASIFWAGADRP